VVIFGSQLDLSNAIRLRLGVPLLAEPISRNTTLTCARAAAVPVTAFDQPVPYRLAFALDLANGHVTAVRTRAGCLHVLRTGAVTPAFVPGGG
jgi:hypothetical protein